MKIIHGLLLFAIGFMPILASSQSFVRDIKTSEDELCISLVEKPGTGYYASILRGIYQENDPGLFEYRNIIYKIDASGNLIDSINFIDTDSLNFTGFSLYINQDEIVAVSSVYYKNDNYYRRAIRITRLDFDLHILNDVMYSKPGYYINGGAAALNNSGNLVMAVYPEVIASGDYYEAALEITPDGDVVRESIIDNFLPAGQVVVLPGGGYLFCDLIMIVSLDENLNYRKLLYEHSQNDALWSMMTSFQAFNDTSCLVTGYKPWDSFDAAWAVIDKNGVWQGQHCFGIQGSDYAGSADFINTDNIYVTRIEGLQGYRNFNLFDFNADGTEQWHHEYNYYGSNHFTGLGIRALSDNSCMLIGRYQTENSAWNEYDLVLIKLNPDGSVTGTQPVVAPSGIALYPNPGNSVMNISGDIQGREFYLYDQAGRGVLHKSISGDKAAIYTGTLANGFYSYRIAGEGKTEVFGKWIKTE